VGGFTNAVGQQQAIYLFDRASGELTRRIGGLPDVTGHLSYSRDGHYLVAALGGANGIRIYRTGDGQEVARDTDYGGDSQWAEFDGNGRIVTASIDGFVRLYGSDFRLLKKQAPPGGKQPFSARPSPDGQMVAVGFEDSYRVNVLSAAGLSLLYAPDTSRIEGGNLAYVTWSADGRMLYAGGRDADVFGTHPVVSWPDGGRGKPAVLVGALETVMELVALSGGRLLLASGQPELGLLDASGHWLWHNTPGIVDWRFNRDKLRLSEDASVVEFGFLTLNGEAAWSRRTARFSLAERRLLLDAPPDRSLAGPRTEGLNLASVFDTEKPTLDGRALAPTPYEMSRSVAISANGDNFLLGTEWYLRWFDRQGREQWNVPVPGAARAVNLTRDGRYAVAALGDGTLRWYATGNGHEVLALFVHRDGIRWIVWTPDGFYDCSKDADELIGYHLNQGPGHAGEFVKADQLRDLFYRSDLVAQVLKPGGAEAIRPSRDLSYPAVSPRENAAGGAEAIRAARERIGDVAAVLKGGLPPDLELLSPPDSQTAGDFTLQFRAKNRGGGVGRVVYRIDGVEIEGRPVDIRLPGSDVMNRTFDLGPGQHQVSATVYNGKNQLESRSISAIVNVAQAEQVPALFVVAAGVTHYRDHALDEGVKYAASDAEAVVRQLKQQGDGLFRQVTVYPLYNEKATRENIDRTVTEVASHIQPGDVFVLYLAGHGTALDGDYYYVPWEASPTSASALRDQGMGQDRIRSLFSRIRTRQTLLLLDTCNAGSYEKASETGVDRLARFSGRATLAATGAGQIALEVNGHGVFTYAVLEGLTQAADSNGVVKVTMLADFVQELVPKITLERWHVKQNPMWIFQGQTFPIARKRTP
jgi:hypothetical protein